MLLTDRYDFIPCPLFVRVGTWLCFCLRSFVIMLSYNVYCTHTTSIKVFAVFAVFAGSALSRSPRRYRSRASSSLVPFHDHHEGIIVSS